MLNGAIHFALIPVLLAQGMQVRARALHLPEADGPRAGRIGEGPPLSLLVLGDSSAAGVGAPHQSMALAGQLTTLLAEHFTVDWQLIAQTGATTRSTLRQLQSAQPAPFDVIVTALGVNDVTHAVPLPTWARQKVALIARLDLLFAPRLIYMSGLPPLGDFPLLPHPLRWSLGRQARRFDARLAQMLTPLPHTRHVPFSGVLDPAQMAEDGFHPGPPLYTRWANEMASRIISDWPTALERR